jgi:hypothetical protein
MRRKDSSFSTPKKKCLWAGRHRRARWFLVSAGVILIFTGGSKLVTAFAGSSLMFAADPIFRIPYRQLFLFTGAVELGVASTCFIVRTQRVSAGLLAVLAVSFFIYRMGLLALGWDGPCPCLGSFTEFLHIPWQKADSMLKGALLYLLVGTCLANHWIAQPIDEGEREITG